MLVLRINGLFGVPDVGTFAGVVKQQYLIGLG